MMNGLEQSDLAIVPLRAANKGTSVPGGARRREGLEPRGIREAKARTGHSAGRA